MNTSPWSIDWHHDVEKSYSKYAHKHLFKEVIHDIQNYPYGGSNIKKLKGHLEGLYRYRRGDFRLLYRIVSKTRKIHLLAFLSRGDVY
jgi:mRNA-degrading endonuclease RelE of RelBE toxin-antitoxin system